MKKAQAMLFVLFLLAIFGALSGALTIMWQAELQTRSSEREGLIAFYLSQAGIERAKIWARYNVGALLPYSSGTIALAQGQYSFTVDSIVGFPNRRRITSTGQTLASGQVAAERRIAVDVRGIGTPPPADDAQVSWSWREI